MIGEQPTPLTEDDIRAQITGLLGDNRVVLFMKGTPQAPRCGFSARVAAALEEVGEPYVGVDVLPDPRVRQVLSAMSEWPTIPQLFVNGELVGGCDIITEMHETGELAPLVKGQDPVEG